ncbi:MAG: diacylglycerol/polyprenol kinase family protein [Clostridia bacterium]|nr:hypothetical protein [Clostridia bacterium]
MKNLVGIIISSVYIVLILVLSKLIAKKGEEASRKFIHILLSNVWIIYYFFIDSLAVACILPIAFTIINTISYKFKILKTMEREKNDGFGTIYYAISILIITVFTYLQKNPMLGMSGMLIMGYGDGMAAVVGKKIKSKEYEVGNAVKTIAGSITMFVISFFISSLVLNLLAVEYFFFKGLVIALVATALEAISIKGLDNITVPIVVTVLTYLCI